MKNISLENCDNVVQVAKEILEAGTLWINIDGEEYYIPDFINDIKKEMQDDQSNI